jgi:RimJ/RimL family protein N-acetyltransferase
VTRAPERIETARLVLRRPGLGDAEAIFARYMSDAAVVRYLGRMRHTSVEESRQFLAVSDSDWERGPAGPFLIEVRDEGRLVGGVHLRFPEPGVALAGYALARDAWGHGYATEAMLAMVDVVRGLGLRELLASCHPENTASIHVLAKCGLVRSGVVKELFPNIDPEALVECPLFVRRLGS